MGEGMSIYSKARNQQAFYDFLSFTGSILDTVFQFFNTDFEYFFERKFAILHIYDKEKRTATQKIVNIKNSYLEGFEKNGNVFVVKSC